MASGRRSVGSSGENIYSDSGARPGGEQNGNPRNTPTQGGFGEDYGKVRVWWEPTDDKQRSGFAGAWWPAKVLSRHKNRLKVKYDNGEEDEVHLDHVSPLDTLPVGFGEEETELQPGEFCEVFNGSKTDPCAWLGRVLKLTKSKTTYSVEYPFHDSKPEKIEAVRIRRARILEDGEWRLIKPGQEWEPGEVSSPKELELIHEDDLGEYVTIEEPEEAHGSGKRSRSSGESSGSSDDDERRHDSQDDGDAARRKKKRSRKANARPIGRPRKSVSQPTCNAPGGPVATSSAPTGMLSLYVTIDPIPGDRKFCFMPVAAGQPVPSNAIQVYFPYSAVPQLRDAAKAQMQTHKKSPDITSSSPAQAAAAKPPSGSAASAAGTAGSQQAAAAGEQRRTRAGKEEKKEVVKRAKSAWNVFLEKNRRAVTDENPGMNTKEINQLLGKKWQEATPEEKGSCEAEAERENAKVEAQRTRKAVAEHTINGPVPARTAEQLYTIEFLKALAAAPGVTTPVAGPTALKAAASAWASADATIRAKYKEAALGDSMRYERERKTWEQSQKAAAAATGPYVAATSATAAAATFIAAPADPAEIDLTDMDDVLNKGVDLKKVQRVFLEMGLDHEAYMLLVDAWRKESPRVGEAVQHYKDHIHGKKPDWQAFLVALLGADKVQLLKRPVQQGMDTGPVGAASAIGQSRSEDMQEYVLVRGCR